MQTKTTAPPKISREEWLEFLQTRVVTAALFAGAEESSSHISLSPPVPRASYPIDQDKAQLWVESHPTDELKAIAQRLLTHIQHVTFDQFKNALQESIAKLNDTYKKAGVCDDEVIIVVPPNIESEKSNTWVTSLALTQLSVKPKYIVTYNERLLKLYLMLDPSIKRILTFDDAAYSGTDLDSFMAGLQKNLRKIIPTLELDIVVPFMTHRAQTKLSSSGNIYCSQTILSIKESLKPNRAEEKLLWEYLCRYQDLELECLALTYFDHKIADKISVPENILTFGLRIDQEVRSMAQRQAFAFIAIIVPPYKSGTHLAFFDSKPQPHAFIVHSSRMILTEKQAVNKILKEQFPLHYAAKKGHHQTIRDLLAQGLSPQSIDFDGNSPLFYAAKKNDEIAFDLLLAGCSDINFREFRGLTPAHRMTSFGRHHLLQKLLLRRPDLSQTDNDDKTPLDLACAHLAFNEDNNAHNIYLCFKMLLPLCGIARFKESTNLPENTVFKINKKPFNTYLLDRMLKSKEYCTDYIFSMFILIQENLKERLFSMTNFDYYFIFKNIVEGNIKYIETHLDSISKNDITDYFGATPLIYAIVLEKPEIVELLIKNGANLKPNHYDCALLAEITGNQEIIEIIKKANNNSFCILF